MCILSFWKWLFNAYNTTIPFFPLTPNPIFPGMDGCHNWGKCMFKNIYNLIRSWSNTWTCLFGRYLLIFLSVPIGLLFLLFWWKRCAVSIDFSFLLKSLKLYFVNLNLITTSFPVEKHKHFLEKVVL